MATDLNGHEILVGDTVKNATGLWQVTGSQSTTIDVARVVTTAGQGSEFEIVATVDGRSLAPAPEPTPVPEPVPAPSGTLEFSDNFEAGITGWTGNWGFSSVPHPVDPLVVTNPRNGMCAMARYIITATGDSHLDDNKYMLHRGALSNRMVVKGDVLIPKNTQLHGSTHPIQRKLLYFKSNYIPDGNERPAFWAFLSSEALTPTDDFVTLRFGFSSVMFNDIGTIKAGEWTPVELEVVCNDPNQTNGSFRLKVGNQPEVIQTGINYRLSATAQDIAYQWQQVEVGQQADRFNWNVVDEYRYWDNVEIYR